MDQQHPPDPMPPRSPDTPIPRAVPASPTEPHGTPDDTMPAADRFSDHISQHPTPRLFITVGIILIVLLVITVGVSMLSRGPITLVFGLAIAVVKALLVAAYFMELRFRSGLMRIFAFAGVFWLGIMITLTLTDFFSRGWV